MSTPRVSVLIPAYRDSALLRRAAASALKQSLTELELVISDDSCGGLRETAAALDDPRVRYIQNKRRLGLAGNHAAALEAARAPIVAFLHDDDEWLPGWLAATVSVLDRDPTVGVVCGDVWLDYGGPWKRRPTPPAGRHADWLALVCNDATFIPSSTVIRRDVWHQRARDLPDLPIGDLVLYLEAAQTDWALHWIGEPLVRYRMHADNAGGQGREFAFRDAVVQIFDSYAFDGAEAEAARRRRLARALIARAGLHVRAFRPAPARADLARAAALARREQRQRRWALGAIASSPRTISAARTLRDLFPRK